MRSHPYVLLKGQFLGISSISSRTISENWGDILLSTLSELLQLYNQWNNLEKFFHATGAGRVCSSQARSRFLAYFHSFKTRNLSDREFCNFFCSRSVWNVTGAQYFKISAQRGILMKLFQPVFSRRFYSGHFLSSLLSIHFQFYDGKCAFRHTINFLNFHTLFNHSIG